MICRMFVWGDLATIGVLVVLEGLLSADNAMVMAVMVLGLPVKQHHKALQYGLIGAFVFRVITTLAAFWLIRLAFVKVIGGLYLLYLPYQHFWGSGESTEQRREPPKAKPWLGLSAFWATVVRVELMNLIFSIDSILAAVAMSPKIRVILAGGMLGIVAMRIVVGRLLALIQKYPAIVEVRGAGLMWGLELNMDAAPVHEAAIRQGVLVNRTAGKVIRLLPPLIITEAELDRALGLLDAAFSEVFAGVTT